MTESTPPELKSNPKVEAFLRSLTHPLHKEIKETRRAILSADPKIQEAIKWNAPSFHTTDFFATFHMRSVKSVQLILHTGAKAKETAQTGIQLEDPAGLCEWLSKDRCRVSLGAGQELSSKLPALTALIQQWIQWV